MDSRAQLGTQAPPLPLAVHGSTFSRHVSRPVVLAPPSSNSLQPGPATAIDLTGNVTSVDDTSRLWPTPLDSALSNSFPPEVILLDDDLPEPPPKRMKVAHEETAVENNGTTLSEDHVTDHTRRVHAGSPFPSLSKPQITVNRSISSRGGRSDAEIPARKAQGVEPPSMATRLPAPRNVADFAPWTGNHLEDIMNEHVVKSGYFDKGQNESSSARPSVWPILSLKNNMGLQTLSYLFTSVLEKRQVLGKCHTASTFKPPPRVTVTDTKREAWLRDLANPDIPLRKQSRTIPHGIRGKILMDQCLSKSIPVQRAVWLAKCVGANELRAFRRKGVSGAAAATGESKWVREWTMAVEQFVESVIGTCGQPDWQTRMSYSVKLVTHLYFEQLLDRAHFLDWLVSSFAEADTRTAPIWIIMTQVYWKDLVASVARGRRLATCLLASLHQIYSVGADENDILRHRLHQLIDKIAVTNRACLIVPKVWAKYGYLLVSSTNTDSQNSLVTIGQNIATRNARLCNATKVSSGRSQHSALALYGLLDRADFIKDPQDMCQQCLLIISNPAQLARHLLEWASSPFREGHLRVYLTAAIIQELHKQGHDTDSGVLDFLETAGDATLVDVDLAYLTIVRLVKLKGFSVGRYLQRLITGPGIYTEQSSFAVGLLAALPPQDLAIHARNLRRTMLLRLDQCDHHAIATHPDFFQRLEDELRTSGQGFPDLPVCSSLGSKLAFSSALRTCSNQALAHTDLTLSSFCYLRNALMQLGDIHGVLDLITTFHVPETATLAAMVDTVNYFASIAAVLGMLDSLADIFLERYRILRTQSPLDRILVTAISDLLERLPGRAEARLLLESDLPLCDQLSISTVCSPASDNIVNIQASDSELDNDIDAIFASGNSMDYKLMERIFVRILSRALKPKADVSLNRSRICSWLRQLRCFDPSAFEQLAMKTVNQLLSTPFSPGALQPTIALIASGCLSLQAVLKVACQIDSPDAASAMISLVILSPPRTLRLATEDLFRFRLAQSRLLDTHANTIGPMYKMAIQSETFPADSQDLETFLVAFIVRDTGMAFLWHSHLNNSPIALSNARRLFQNLINRGKLGKANEALSPTSIMSLAQPLSIRVCENALRFFILVSSPESGKEVKALLVQHVTNDTQVWPDLLQACGEPIQRSLHEWTHEQLLVQTSNSEQDVSRYLQVMALTNHAAVNEDGASILFTLVEQLRDVDKQLGDLNGGDVDSTLRSISGRLMMLFQIAAMHVETDHDTDVRKQGRSGLLTALCSILASPHLQMKTAILEFAFDLASTVYDGLPEAMVTSIVRTFQSCKTRNALVEAVLNITQHNEDAWLVLASQTQPPMSQQQRALSRHAQLHQQQSQPPQQQQQQQQQQPIRPALGAAATPSLQRQGTSSAATPGKMATEPKITPFPLRKWELISDPTPVMGENDASLSLSLFGARKV